MTVSQSIFIFKAHLNNTEVFLKVLNRRKNRDRDIETAEQNSIEILKY